MNGVLRLREPVVRVMPFALFSVGLTRTGYR
jgi:hypothetical protein